MDLNAQVAEELVLSFYVPAEATMPERFTLDYRVGPEELEAVVAELGGADVFRAIPTSPLLTRHDAKVTHNGEEVARLVIQVWLDAPPPEKRYPAVERLLERKAVVADA